MHSSPIRTVATALTPLAAVAAIWAVAPTATAAPLTASEPQVCQYSYDQAWRVVPVTLTGTLTNGGGTELSPGASIPAGSKVRLTNASVTAELPGWIGPFAYDGGIIGNGTTQLPIHGWIALEATNTAEGVTAPIRIDTTAVAHADVGPGQAPSEESVSFEPVTATIPTQEWTASGGDVLVRQAVGTKMAAIPAGRDGSLVQVNGSLFVAAELDANTRLFLDCLSGSQLEEGANHTDKLPDPLTSLGFRAPAFAGSVDGAPLADPVDAQLENSALFRGVAGQAVTVDGSRLRLRLNPAQRSAWLGGSGATVSGAATIVGDRSTVGQQTVSLAPTAISGGTSEVVLDVPATTWTPTGSTGVDLRSADAITLQALVGGTPRSLTLTRDASLRSAAYPFAYVLGPDPRTRFDDPTPPEQGGPTNPPELPTAPGFAPPPVRVTKPSGTTAPVATVRVASSSLKRTKGKLRIRLTNLSKTATTKGRYKLVTTAKYRVGKSTKKRTITLVASRSFSLAKGKSTTYTAKLSKDAATLLKTRKSVKAKLTVTPSSTKTQKTVTRTLTVKR